MEQASKLVDAFSRPLRNLRVSVTDRCNLRCQYCMPEPDYVWLPRDDVLSFEEITRLARCFTTLGVEAVRLTGGEPLLRTELPELVRQLSQVEGLKDLAMTTNGVQLAEHAEALRTAGLRRLTVSLDTLRPERFLALTRRDYHRQVLEGLEVAAGAGFDELKIDSVILRGTNDDEVVELLEYGSRFGAEVRFIEYMDVGGATRWSFDQVVTRVQLLATLTTRYGAIRPLPAPPSAPAERFALPDGRAFGIIASTTAPFCARCDRSRLTADGTWYLCLYARSGVPLRAALRGKASDEELCALIRSAWKHRRDRGAEERLEVSGRGPLIAASQLRADPHLEMHTRGG